MIVIAALDRRGTRRFEEAGRPPSWRDKIRDTGYRKNRLTRTNVVVFSVLGSRQTTMCRQRKEAVRSYKRVARVRLKGLSGGKHRAANIPTYRSQPSTSMRRKRRQPATGDVTEQWPGLSWWSGRRHQNPPNNFPNLELQSTLSVVRAQERAIARSFYSKAREHRITISRDLWRLQSQHAVA